MNLVRHLTYFVAVAEELHFGRAADRLHMAQSPLSRRIRHLEREFGVQLFARTSRNVALTPAGRVLLDDARQVLARVDDLSALVRQVREGTFGELRAALPPQVGAPVLARILRAFGAERPQVRLEMTEAPTSEQVRALRSGALDVGLLLHPIGDATLVTGPVVEKPLGVLIRDDGPLADRDEVDLGELDRRPLVVFPRESAPAAFDHLLATCRSHGFAPEDVHEAPRREFGLGLVMAGEAIALAGAPPGGSEGVVWKPLSGRPLTIGFSTAWRAEAHTPSIDAYTNVAVEALLRSG